MKMDGRAAIVDIDDDERVVVFDTYKLNLRCSEKYDYMIFQADRF